MKKTVRLLSALLCLVLLFTTFASPLSVTASSHTKHTLVEVEAKKATCTKAGNKTYYKCTVCEKLFSDAKGTKATTVADVKIKAKGHKLTKVAAKKATCTKAGSKAYYKCSVCKKLYSDAKGTKVTTVAKMKISAKGHNLSKVAYKAPTATKSGHKAYYKCSVCGKVFKDSKGKQATTVSAMTIKAKGSSSGSSGGSSSVSGTYVLNTDTMKFHYPSCRHAKKISASNKSTYSGSRGDLISRGYSPCGTCKP